MGGERPSGEESTLSLSQRELIDRLADQFEREFKAGEQPRIEAYLEQAPELRMPLLKQLMGLEVEFRQAGGQEPTPEEYRQRFPDAGKIVDALFAIDATDTEDDPIPERLGRYTIQRRLGRGGFGVVYLTMIRSWIVRWRSKSLDANDSRRRNRWETSSRRHAPRPTSSIRAS